MTVLKKPGVVGWFKVYCGILVLISLLQVLAGISLFFARSETLEIDHQQLFYIVGVIFLSCGAAQLPLSLLPFFLRPKRWVWIYSLVPICFGILYGYLIPICIPLLIFWLKKEAKVYYGYADVEIKI